MISFKQIIRGCGVRFARLVGGEIRDVKTGELLGRGLAFSWRNKTHLIGYEGKPLIAVFEVQQRTTYWRQTLGFTTHPAPDFLNERASKNEMAVSEPLKSNVSNERDDG